MANSKDFQQLEQMLKEYDQAIPLPEKLKGSNLISLLQDVEQITEEDAHDTQAKVVSFPKRWQWAVAAALMLTIGVTVYPHLTLDKGELYSGAAPSSSSMESVAEDIAMPQAMTGAAAPEKGEGKPFLLDSQSVEDAYVMADNYDRIRSAISAGGEKNIQKSTSDIAPRSAMASISPTLPVSSGEGNTQVASKNDNIFYVSRDEDKKAAIYVVNAKQLSPQLAIPMEAADGDVKIQIYENLLVVAANRQTQRQDTPVQSRLWMYDIENPQSPKLTRSFVQEGKLLQTGVVDGDLYLLSTKKVNPDMVEQDATLVPYICEGENLSNAVPLEPTQVAISDVQGGAEYVVASVVPLENSQSAQTMAVLGTDGNAYLEKNNLYLTFAQNNNQVPTTRIVRIGMEDEGLQMTGMTTVEGSVQGENSLSEAQGILYAVTTQPEGSNLCTFDENLNLAREEQVVGKELIEDITYLEDSLCINTKQALHRIDLANPDNRSTYSTVGIMGATSMVAVDSAENSSLKISFRPLQETEKETVVALSGYQAPPPGTAAMFYLEGNGIFGMAAMNIKNSPPVREYILVQLHKDGTSTIVTCPEAQEVFVYDEMLLFSYEEGMNIYDISDLSTIKNFE